MAECKVTKGRIHRGICGCGYNTSQKESQWIRQGKRCFYCLMDLSLEKATEDHWFPKSDGNSLKDNMVVACSRCNNRKADMSPTKFMRKKLKKKKW